MVDAGFSRSSTLAFKQFNHTPHSLSVVQAQTYLASFSPIQIIRFNELK